MFASILAALILSFDVETGYIPYAASSAYQTPKEIEFKATKNVFMLDLKPSFEWVFVYGNVDLTAFSASPKGGQTFVPFRMSYSNEFGLFYKAKTFKASLCWEHNCQHQVMVATYFDSEKRFNDFGYDKIFLRVSFSNR